MGKKLYSEESVQDIANAIREKNGLTDTYTLAEMGDAVRAIPTGTSGLTVKKVSWVGVEGWSKDIEIPIEDINCTVLRIVAKNPQGIAVLGAEAFEWGSSFIRYANTNTWQLVNSVTYPSPNIMHVVGAGQSTSQCFNHYNTQYDMYYTTWDE